MAKVVVDTVRTFMNDTYYTTRDAASALNISVKTAQLWVEGGILQAWKTPGGHRRITRESVQQLLDQRQFAVIKPGASAEVGGAATIAQPHILIVEDDARTRQLYELTIKHWGLPLRLSMAGNGFEGLLRIGENLPDLLVTDLDMPGMNGFKMIASLRAVERYRSLRIVVVSGMSQSDIREAGGLPENIQVLSKPIPFSALRKLVETEILSK
jgi:excisionase family DNA binding protein